jgi:glycerol-3-phosphate dehydrogenase
MAEDTVDEALELIGRRARCRTKRLRLVGADGGREAAAGSLAAHLAGRHGSLAVQVQRLIDADASLGEPLVAGLPYVRAEAVHAVRNEMARSLDDVLSRRTRSRMLERTATLAAAPAVAQLIAADLGWDDAEIDRQVATFRALVSAEVAAGMTSEAEFIAQVTGADR